MHLTHCHNLNLNMQCVDWFSWGLTTRQPLWVILCHCTEFITHHLGKWKRLQVEQFLTYWNQCCTEIEDLAFMVISYEI